MELTVATAAAVAAVAAAAVVVEAAAAVVAEAAAAAVVTSAVAAWLEAELSSANLLMLQCWAAASKLVEEDLYSVEKPRWCCPTGFGTWWPCW